MGIFVLCAVMAFRIAAKDHKIAEVDVCVATADGATYQLCVCVCLCGQASRRHVGAHD